MNRFNRVETFPADLSNIQQVSISKFLPLPQDTDTADISVAISNVIRSKDRYTEAHGRRVSIYAQRLALRQGLSEEGVEQVRLGGLLHDIGKISFSDKTFLNESATLSDHMSSEIMAHPSIGRSILEDLNFMEPVPAYVYAHHERADGQGYPQGLTMDRIPLGAQIISVADHFDAMTTDRPYKKRMACEEAFSVMRDSGALSPDLVESFIDDVEENGVLVS